MRRGGLVFIDKDGTLVENVPYNVDPALVRLSRGAEHAIPRLVKAGLRLVVVSNQPGVALGRFPESALVAVRERLAQLLAPLGAELAGFYYCPHHPRGSVAEYAIRCNCRKPAPGLIERAARELGVSAKGAWLVGDILDDVEAGSRAGCSTILLDNGNETEWVLTPQRRPDYIVRDLDEAADFIVSAGVTAPPLAERPTTDARR
ncbi:MAG TPA: HAD-IIIA family hydrolase [Gemmatimonadaceae bacterium]|nr:HAD-IIIA family hydrolase [Gemmatimonadaceae bacterium]